MVKEVSLDWHTLETQEEFSVVDKAGRVQIPRELLDSLALDDNKLKVELVDGKIILSKPEEKTNETV